MTDTLNISTCKKCSMELEVNKTNFYYRNDKALKGTCRKCKIEYNKAYCKEKVNYKDMYNKRMDYLKDLSTRHSKIKMPCSVCNIEVSKPYFKKHLESSKHKKLLLPTL